MRICDITNFYHEKSGGVKTYLHQKMDYLARHRHDEHLVLVPGPADAEKRFYNSTVYQIKAPEVPFARPYRMITQISLVNWIVERFSPDIIEVGCPFFIPWAIAYSQKHSCRTAGFYHSDFPRACIRTTNRFIGKIPAAVLEKGAYGCVRALYRRMDINFAPSVYAAAALFRHGVGNVSILPLGVDLGKFHPHKRDPHLRRQLGIPGERLLVLYAGRFAREKGLDVLQQAFDRLSAQSPGRYHLLLVGEGPVGPDLSKWSAGRNDVTVNGYLPQKQLAAVYASADLFVTAGSAETFGLTILEAQASGLPVVAVTSGAAAEAVAPGAGVLVEPGNPEILAGAMARIAVQNLHLLGGAARKHMEVNYGWDKTFDSLFAQYQNLTVYHPRSLEKKLSSAVTGRKIAGA